jgi:hypothetical protein
MAIVKDNEDGPSPLEMALRKIQQLEEALSTSEERVASLEENFASASEENDELLNDLNTLSGHCDESEEHIKHLERDLQMSSKEQGKLLEELDGLREGEEAAQGSADRIQAIQIAAVKKIAIVVAAKEMLEERNQKLELELQSAKDGLSMALKEKKTRLCQVRSLRHTMKSCDGCSSFLAKEALNNSSAFINNELNQDGNPRRARRRASAINFIGFATDAVTGNRQPHCGGDSGSPAEQANGRTRMTRRSSCVEAVSMTPHIQDCPKIDRRYIASEDSDPGSKSRSRFQLQDSLAAEANTIAVRLSVPDKAPSSPLSAESVRKQKISSVGRFNDNASLGDVVDKFALKKNNSAPTVYTQSIVSESGATSQNNNVMGSTKRFLDRQQERRKKLHQLHQRGVCSSVTNQDTCNAVDDSRIVFSEQNNGSQQANTIGQSEEINEDASQSSEQTRGSLLQNLRKRASCLQGPSGHGDQGQQQEAEEPSTGVEEINEDASQSSVQSRGSLLQNLRRKKASGLQGPSGPSGLRDGDQGQQHEAEEPNNGVYTQSTVSESGATSQNNNVIVSTKRFLDRQQERRKKLHQLHQRGLRSSVANQDTCSAVDDSRIIFPEQNNGSQQANTSGQSEEINEDASQSSERSRGLLQNLRRKRASGLQGPSGHGDQGQQQEAEEPSTGASRTREKPQFRLMRNKAA